MAKCVRMRRSGKLWLIERIVGRGTNDAEVRKVEQNERNGVVREKEDRREKF